MSSLVSIDRLLQRRPYLGQDHLVARNDKGNTLARFKDHADRPDGDLERDDAACRLDGRAGAVRVDWVVVWIAFRDEADGVGRAQDARRTQVFGDIGVGDLGDGDGHWVVGVF